MSTSINSNERETADRPLSHCLLQLLCAMAAGMYRFTFLKFHFCTFKDNVVCNIPLPPSLWDAHVGVPPQTPGQGGEMLVF
jgi:hypothetical protein